MKAIRVKEFGGPEVLRLEEVPTLRPGPDQVLVRMHAIGINPVETYIRAGTYARLPELPYTPGTDGAGVGRPGLPCRTVSRGVVTCALRTPVHTDATPQAGAVGPGSPR